MCFHGFSPGPADHPCNRTMGLPNWVTQATESKTTAIVADRHLGVTRESGVTCATPARSVGPP